MAPPHPTPPTLPESLEGRGLEGVWWDFEKLIQVLLFTGTSPEFSGLNPCDDRPLSSSLSPSILSLLGGRKEEEACVGAHGRIGCACRACGAWAGTQGEVHVVLMASSQIAAKELVEEHQGARGWLNAHALCTTPPPP